MGHKWIIDVLTDLRSFAQDNDLALLADQLAQTTMVASVEIAEVSERTSFVMCSDGDQIGSVTEGPRAS